MPVAVNGKKLPGHELMAKLNALGGKHAVGQVDLVENRLVGIKSRGAYETPGGTILYEAHRALESITLDRETLHYKQQVALKYAEMVYYGQWFCPLREALDAFVTSTQRNVTGTVRVKCFKGRATAAGVDSPHSLYCGKLASFTMGSEYTPSDAIGFIKLFGLQMRGRGRDNYRKTVRGASPRQWLHGKGACDRVLVQGERRIAHGPDGHGLVALPARHRRLRGQLSERRDLPAAARDEHRLSAQPLPLLRLGHSLV